MDESLHNESDNPEKEKELHLAGLYVEAIAAKADEGADVVVLPEKAFVLKGEIDSVILKLFSEIAAKKKVAVIFGATRITDEGKANRAIVISKEGKIVSDYQKVNLFEGEVYGGFKPGNQTAFFALDDVSSGIAICKDLDFEQFIRKYNEGAISVLFAPAWDFVQDDWLHSRMAIVRGVENGFSIVRVARQGRLTISDPFGGVLVEASGANGKQATCSGQVPVGSSRTFYAKTGDWFGYLMIAAAVYFLFFYPRRREANNK
jgi:apolipoprotein N-acyltransferase